MRGKLIVVEGLDGSGKATQSELLLENLINKGIDAAKLTFPRYHKPSGTLAKMYLNGEFGTNPDDVSGYASSVFYAVDRFASFKEEWEKDYKDGKVFVLDRYTTSNAVFQTAKYDKEKWSDFVEWLYDFEYNKMGIPKPDLVVYLDMSPTVSEKLMSERYDGDEQKKDIHERDIEYQNKCRTAARFCAKQGNWLTVKCDDGNAPFSKQEIAKKIMEVVGEKLNIC